MTTLREAIALAQQAKAHDLSPTDRQVVEESRKALARLGRSAFDSIDAHRAMIDLSMILSTAGRGHASIGALGITPECLRVAEFSAMTALRAGDFGLPSPDLLQQIKNDVLRYRKRVELLRSLERLMRELLRESGEDDRWTIMTPEDVEALQGVAVRAREVCLWGTPLTILVEDLVSSSYWGQDRTSVLVDRALFERAKSRARVTPRE